MAAGLPSVAPFAKGMDFSRWLKGLEFYAEAMDITDDRRRTAVLLHLMGPDIQDVFDTLPEPTAAATAATSQYDTAVAKLRQYLQPTSNLMAERVTFHRTSMYAGESFDAYLARLRAVAGRCGFPAADLDRELRDRSVAGATPQIQERLLQTVGTKVTHLATNTWSFFNASRTLDFTVPRGSLRSTLASCWVLPSIYTFSNTSACSLGSRAIHS